MRPGQHNKRGRSRNRHRSGGGGGSGGNPLNRVYESNGPDVKVRGTAQTVAEKYLQLGRDAHSSGDSVMAESYYQHAEHYLRIVAAAQAYSQQMQQQYRRPDEDGDDEEGYEDGEIDEIPQAATVEPVGQPVVADVAEPAAAPEGDGERQPQQSYRPPRDYRDRDAQGQPGGRESGGQSGSRDRYKPRWQDRRGDRPPPMEQPREAGYQPRSEEPPRDVPMAPAVAKAEEAPGQWEAPSFLRRPAPVTPVAEAASEAAPTERKPRYERKPRREKTAEPAEPAIPDVSGD